MRSGDPAINRNDASYRSRFTEIVDKHFTKETDHAYPALVSKVPVNGHRLWKPYDGGDYDKEQFDIVHGVRDQEHCSICDFKIRDEHTCWTNENRACLLCDECHDVFMPELTKHPKIQEYLEDYRHGDSQNAFYRLTTMSHDVLPDLITAFKKERDGRVRVFLVETIWQHRQQSVIPFLAECVFDPEPDIWKEALSGLVTLASPQAIDALRSARSRQFPRERDTDEYRSWIDEAIEQAEAELQKLKDDK